HIGFDRDGLATRTFDARDQIVQPILAPRRQRHGGPGARKRLRGALADPATGAGDKRDCAIKTTSHPAVAISARSARDAVDLPGVPRAGSLAAPRKRRLRGAFAGGSVHVSTIETPNIQPQQEPPPRVRDWQGHVIVCGLHYTSLRTIELLHAT